MNSAARLLAFFALVLLIGASTAPIMYWMVQEAARVMPGLQGLAANPFHRFVNRCMLATALLGLFPLLRSLGGRSLNFSELRSPRQGSGLLARGLGLGFVSLALVTVLAVVAGGRTVREVTAQGLAWHLLNAVGAAALVSLMEEVIFRGGIYRCVRRTETVAMAAAMSSFLYALTHFFARVEFPGEVTWASGFVVLGGMLKGFTAWETMVPGFFNLFLAGLILAELYEKSGSLFLPIGVHAGWIFWIKSYGFFTTESSAANTMIAGTSRMTDGWIATVVLIAVFVWTRYKVPARHATNYQPPSTADLGPGGCCS